MTDELPTRARFQDAYESRKPPWDIGRPQRAIIEAIEQVEGPILDAGCGTGEHALYFAQRGHEVTGIDFLETPIQLARKKATERGLSAEFLVHDALQLATLNRRYRSIIDCGLFHVFSDEDRVAYVESLAAVTEPGGILLLLCFSDKEPAGGGPRRVSEHELRAAFSRGWDVLSIVESRFEVRPDLDDLQFSEGGPFAWLSVMRRSG